MPTPLLNRIPDSYETRSFSEVRTDAEIGTFTGHASAFWYADSYATSFAPKAFRKTLGDKAGRIPVLYFHEPKEMVGPTQTLREDKQGLYHESKAVDDGRTGTYVLAHLRGGTPMGMSFGFATRKDRAATDTDPIDLSTGPEGVKRSDIRVITEVELFEISVLPWVFASQQKADISSVRAVSEAATLSTLLEDLRSGALTPEDDRWDVLHQLVAAWGERAEPEPSDDTPLPAATARRLTPRDIEIAIALGKSRGWLGA